MLLKLLRKIDSHTLRRLVGDDIINAVKCISFVESENELANILLMKYGNDILKEKEVRKAIIDSLDKKTAMNFCGQLKIAVSKDYESYEKLITYFSSFSLLKSQQLVDFLDLDKGFYLQNESDERSPDENVSIMENPNARIRPFLHSYQKRIKDDVVKLIRKPGRKCMVQMPTGAGKTYTALEAVVDLLRSPGFERYIVWLVDSNELAEQSLQSFKNLWVSKGDHPLRAFRLFKSFMSDFSRYKGGVVFASFDIFNSIMKNTETARYSHLKHLIENTDLLIVDEAHASIAETYIECIEHFSSQENTRVVGLTATPGRNAEDESQDLQRAYSRTIIDIKDDNGEAVEDCVEFLQADGYLARLKFEDLDSGVTIRENSEKSILKEIARNPERNKCILNQIELAQQNQESTLVFACSLDHVIALSILCKKKGIEAHFITGHVSQIKRLEILENFKDRKFFILINLDILSTGIDVPSLNKLIITRPVGSRILFSQILGRALRGPKNGGNAVNTVVSIKDNLLNFPSAQLVYNWFRHQWN